MDLGQGASQKGTGTESQSKTNTFMHTEGFSYTHRQTRDSVTQTDRKTLLLFHIDRGTQLHSDTDRELIHTYWRFKKGKGGGYKTIKGKLDTEKKKNTS